MVWGKTVAIDAQEPASGTQAPAPMSIHTAAGTKDFARTARNSFGYLAVAVGSVRRLRADADFDQVITPITCAVADQNLRSLVGVGYERRLPKVVTGVRVSHRTGGGARCDGPDVPILPGNGDT